MPNDTLTDWYSLLEKGMADRLRAELKILEYVIKDQQVSDSDAVLQMGFDYFAIFRPGPFPFLPASYKTGEIIDVDWTTFIHLYVKFKQNDEQWATFKPYRNAIIQLLMKHRFLKKVSIGDDYPEEFAEVLNIDRIRGIGGNDQPGYFRFFGVAENMPPNFMTQMLSVSTRQRVRFL